MDYSESRHYALTQRVEALQTRLQEAERERDEVKEERRELRKAQKSLAKSYNELSAKTEEAERKLRDWEIHSKKTILGWEEAERKLALAVEGLKNAYLLCNTYTNGKTLTVPDVSAEIKAILTTLEDSNG